MIDAKRYTTRGHAFAHLRRRPVLLAMAAAMTAAAMVVRHQTRKAERANPPAGRFMEVDGVRLHYVERGEGPPLVLLHGNGTMIQDYQLSGLLNMAAERYRVIAFDRPGYGYSARPRTTVWTPTAQAHLLHKALEQLGIERAVVVGHSWGTLVAVALGLEHPSDVGSLVLLSGYFFATARVDVPLLSGPAIPLVGDLMRYTISPLLGRMMWPGLLKMMFGPSAVPSRFNAFPVWMALRPSQIRAGAAESALMIPAALRLRRRYRELSMPVTIVAGTGDRIASARAQSERLHSELSGSRLHLIPHAGHMVHHIVPHEVMAAIDEAMDAASIERKQPDVPSVLPQAAAVAT